MTLFFVLLFSTQAPASKIGATNTGKVSEAEVALLWNSSAGDVQTGDTRECIRKLERLIARYPASKHFHEAHLRLALCYQAAEEYRKSVPLLRTYVTREKKSADAAFRAQLLLGETFLRLKDLDSARMTALELVSKIPTSKLPAQDASELGARAQLLSGEVYAEKAELKLLDEAILKSEGLVKSGFSGRWHLLKLRRSALHCSNEIPYRSPMSEASVFTSIRQTGLCLNKVLLGFENVAKAKDPLSTGAARAIAEKTARLLLGRCENPPAPVETEPKPRTQEEKKRYLKELQDALQSDCALKLSEARSLLNSMKANAGEALDLKAEFDTLSQSLESLNP